MRHNILKRKSTKAERIIYEILKELHIPFRHRWKLEDLEIDFLIGEKYAIDIDGHDQKPERNYKLIELGFIPIHFSNQEIKNNRELIKKEFIKYVINKSNSPERRVV